MSESIEFRQLDVSDQTMVDLLIDHLDSGSSVRLLEIIKSGNSSPKFTFRGNIKNQEGSGIIIDSYCNKIEGSLVIIE